MRILHLDTDQAWRGGQIQVAMTIGSLTSLGHENHLLTARNSVLKQKLQERVPSVMVHELSSGKHWSPGAIALIRKLHKRYHYDLMHAHSSHSHSMAFMAKLLGGMPPMIVTRRLELPPARSWMGKWKYRAAAEIICISHAVQDAVEASGIPKEKLALIPSGANLDEIRRQPKDEQLLRALGLNPDRPVIGNAGALSPQKDQKTFIQAAAIVHQAYPEVQFVIAGEGELRAQLEEQIRHNGLEQVCVLAGFQERIYSLMKTWDLFVLTSIFEGLCSTLVQTMTCEVPIVATEVGGVPDLIINERTGVLVPPKNPEATAQAIMRYLNHPEAFARYRQAAAEHVLDYDYGRLGPRIVKVYADVLNRR